VERFQARRIPVVRRHDFSRTLKGELEAMGARGAIHPVVSVTVTVTKHKSFPSPAISFRSASSSGRAGPVHFNGRTKTVALKAGTRSGEVTARRSVR